MEDEEKISLYSHPFHIIYAYRRIRVDGGVLSIFFRNHIKNYLHLRYDVLPGGQAIAEVEENIQQSRKEPFIIM